MLFQILNKKTNKAIVEVELEVQPVDNGLFKLERHLRIDRTVINLEQERVLTARINALSAFSKNAMTQRELAEAKLYFYSIQSDLELITHFIQGAYFLGDLPS